MNHTTDPGKPEDRDRHPFLYCQANDKFPFSVIEYGKYVRKEARPMNSVFFMLNDMSTRDYAVHTHHVHFRFHARNDGFTGTVQAPGID